ncbi:MAG TPA: sodium:proton antiporter [Nitrolancea sp.]|nr:sodium:proton antiporter [Nitrolancea sp.]
MSLFDVCLLAFPAHPTAADLATAFTWLLGTTVVVAVVARFVRIPTTVALVIVGLVVGVSVKSIAIPLPAGLILRVFMPILLFEAAYAIPWGWLRRELSYVSALAIPGVLVGTLIVGAIVHVAGLSWGGALLFGALTTATDPISVLATFRQLGAPRRLALIVEGESLFNDATALVLFGLILSVVLTGHASATVVGIAFIVSLAGGILLGGAVGVLTIALRSRLDDSPLQIAATVALAFGTFTVAEYLHATVSGTTIGVSPVIAVVVYGLILGNHPTNQAMSRASRSAMDTTWEFLGATANALLFLLIGLQINAYRPRMHDIPLILWSIAALLLSRAFIVSSLLPIVDHFSRSRKRPREPRRTLPRSYSPVIIWGGLRGALALAAALSLPDGLPERRVIEVMTFAIVLFTVVVQGLTIGPLVTALGLHQPAAPPHRPSSDSDQQVASTE